MSVFSLLSQSEQFSNQSAKFCSTECAIISNFLLTEFWAFKSLNSGAKNATIASRFVRYQAVCAAALLLGPFLVLFFVATTHLSKYLANLATIALVAIFNYFGQVYFTWARAKN